MKENASTAIFVAYYDAGEVALQFYKTEKSMGRWTSKRKDSKEPAVKVAGKLVLDLLEYGGYDATKELETLKERSRFFFAWASTTNDETIVFSTTVNPR